MSRGIIPPILFFWLIMLLGLWVCVWYYKQSSANLAIINMDYHPLLYFLPYTQLTFLLPHALPHTHTHTETPSSKDILDCHQHHPQRKASTTVPDEESEYELEKRSYHRRRNNQWKSFLCSEQGCSRRYSSSNALSNHLRLNHNIRSSERSHQQ